MQTHHPGGGVRSSEASRERTTQVFAEALACVGHASRGVVYLIIGSLACMAAVGEGGSTTGFSGAFAMLLRQPFGQIMLMLLACGLACYGLCQMVMAVRHPHAALASKGVAARRVTLIPVGLFYFGMALAAAQLVRHARRFRSDSQVARDGTATLMSYPLGRWAVAGVGIGIMIFGLYQLFSAYRGDRRHQFHSAALGPAGRTWIEAISRFGIGARGIVFVTIGVFLIAAAYWKDPRQARSVGGALHTLARQPYGPWILGIVALGLVAFGIRELLMAAHRRLDA